MCLILEIMQSSPTNKTFGDNKDGIVKCDASIIKAQWPIFY